MAYITRAERIGIKKGREEGLEKGRQERREEVRKESNLKFFRFLLQEKFPDSPLDIYESEIAAADEDKLFKWTRSVINAQDLKSVFGH